MPEINVAKYIAENYTVYDGDSSFLAPATEATKDLWAAVEKLQIEEREKGILDVDNKTVSGIDAFAPGYICKEKETIVGVQADAPLKRTIKPYGGWRVVEAALKSYGYEMDAKVLEIFTKYRKTHNQGTFDVYTPQMRALRSNHLLTGLPDAYGRGRIIGDYRRIALYGVDALIEAKKADKLKMGEQAMTEEVIRASEELADQIVALKELKNMGASYGFDLSKPATCAKEAIQFTYLGYLAAVKQQDGAAMSFGRVDAFFDIYIEKDIAEGKITESEAQEMIDHLVMKLRLVRHLRTPEYNQLFAGDPTWVTCVLGGVLCGKKHMVTKTSYRMLQTLYNMGPAPEPNITILWSKILPQNYKDFCCQVSIETSSIQYENDDMVSQLEFGSDYGVACCVSAMRLGKDMQFFGARCNLPKLLLYVLNGGRDEINGKQVGPEFPKIEDGPLDYETVMKNYLAALEWLAEAYVNTMNVIHYMHDKYSYESLQMALHESEVHRFLAFGIAGISVVADSFSAMKNAKVTPIRGENGLTTDFKIEGEFPKYGNDIDEVDNIAVDVLSKFMAMLRKHKAYRNAEHTLSVLTITSNVVYGNATGNTPDGRKKGEPFGPGANPMHGCDNSGALASLNSVAKLPYLDSKDGISNTFSILPSSLGKEDAARVKNLGGLLDGYFAQNAHHINVNVLNREQLLDAVDHPEKYPNLTIRVSGYAVHFTRLTRAQQMDVITRTFHEHM